MKTDTQMQIDVRDELRWDARVTPTDIGVMVKDGVVTLTGDAPHFVEKKAAEEAAQRVNGVRAVANEIKVKFLDYSTERSDQDIGEAAISALKWSYEAPSDVRVSVSNGAVTLKGTAEWNYQRNAAKAAVMSLAGVSDVINEIILEAKVQPSDVKARIEAALKRSAVSEGDGITVEVKRNQVTLKGKVHSLTEKEDVRWAAYLAPGVTQVDNQLNVAS